MATIEAMTKKIGNVTGKTSISVDKDLRDQLAELGGKDSTFSEIIDKLIKKWNEDN